LLRAPNKTLAWEDLREPATAEARLELLRFLRRSFTFRAQPVAVNGVWRRRWYVRRLKLWEYARGWAIAPVGRGQKLLDFGGGGTLTPFYAASLGAEVCVLDLDHALIERSEQLCRKRQWPMKLSTANLATADGSWPQDWPVGQFDAVHSFCVLEHIPYAGQEVVLARLAEALAPGGKMVLSFEFGERAPGEAPWHDLERLEAMQSILLDSGMQLIGNAQFEDNGHREVLDQRHPDAPFTFGMLALEKSS